MRRTDPMGQDALQELAQRVAVLETGQARVAVEEAIQRTPGSAKLHFLRGSLRAESGDYAGALEDFGVAAELNPDLAIARFQLGLLQLCLGEAERAKRTWEPLDRLDDGDCLRLFKQGLCLIADERLPEAIEFLRAGQVANRSYLPLNRDMQILVDRALERVGTKPEQTGDEGSHLLLAGYLGGTTRH